MDTFHDGYPKVAAAEVCDPNFLILRKFGWLHLRVFLRLQDELAELEEELRELDNFDYGDDYKKLQSRRRDEGIDSVRKDLLSQIQLKLAVYGWRCEIVEYDPRLIYV